MIFYLEKYTTGEDIESLSQAIDKEHPKKLEIDIGKFRDARMFANSRLLALLRKCQSSGIIITVKIAETINEVLENKRNKRLFLDSTTGYILAYFATEVINNSGTNYRDQILKEQFKELNSTVGIKSDLIKRDYQPKQRGVIGSGREKTALFFNSMNSPSPAEIFKSSQFPGSPKTFSDSFSSILKEIGLDIKQHRLRVQKIGSDIGFETTQNISDHALFDNNDVPIKQLQFIHFHRVNIGSNNIDLEYIGRNSNPVLADYLKGVEEKYSNRSDIAFYEISFSDCGIGIPAKISANDNVYQDSFEYERELLENALNEGVSSKKEINENTGFGFTKIMNTVKEINGLILFRTGRLLMYKHFLINNSDRINQLFEWDKKERSYLPGTTVSILFPLITKDAINQLDIEWEV